MVIINKVVLHSKLYYHDPKYGFTVKLPCWWRKYIVVRTKSRLSDGEYGVFFLFKYKGKIYEEVLTLLVFRMTRKQWLKQYEDSPIIFIAERKGRIFAYVTPEELPSEFLNKSKQDYDYKKYGKPIRLLKRMVNINIPAIVKKFHFR